MERVRDPYVRACPFCGGTEMIRGKQGGYAAVGGENALAMGEVLHIVICRRCGSVVRSFVESPEKLLRRKNRRESGL